MAVVRRPASRFRLLVVLLVLVSLTLITLDASGRSNSALNGVRNAFSSVLSPVQSGIHAALRPVGDFLTGAVDYGTMQAENRRLRNEVAALRTQQAQASFAEQQADQILQENRVPWIGSIHRVTAPIIDIGSSNFAVTVTIGKGADAGVSKYQPVVAANGLAGVVSQVTAHTATVTLITDVTFTVGVRLQGNNVGYAQGQGPGDLLKVTVVPGTGPPPVVKKGSILSTSGLSTENYPPGIPVGRVTAVSHPSGELSPTITVRPLVNAASLQYVQVLLWSPQ